jgi:hypothetical protein
MNNLLEIRNKWSWEEIMEREYIELKNGNVDKWLESIFSKQKYPNDFYDVAHSQLMYQHICQIKEIVNIIIEKIKRREFNSRNQVDQINELIEIDINQINSYGKLQTLFKQNGNLMSEASKLIYYLDEVTLSSNNMVKTMLDYYNATRINKIMIQKKINLDKRLWEVKRKEYLNEPSRKRRSVVLDEDDNSDKLKITIH